MALQPHAGVGVLLKPLAPFLARPEDDIVEISINRDREAWIKWACRGYQRVAIPELTHAWAENICHTLANANGRSFSRQRPLLSCTLPMQFGGHRVQGLLGPNIGSGMALSIRLRRNVAIAWESFGFAEDGALLDPPAGRRGHWRHQAARAAQAARQDLENVMANMGSGLIVGGTDTGKTTFLNALLRSLPKTARLITIEDVSEIRPVHENWVQILVARSETGTELGYGEIIDSILRFNPDALICSELSTHNIEAVVRLLNTGHGAFWSTVHANSCLDALEAIRRNFELATRRDLGPSLGYIAACFDRLIALEAIEIDNGEIVKWITEIIQGRTLDWHRLTGAK